jgi:hypothetical protein
VTTARASALGAGTGMRGLYLDVLPGLIFGDSTAHSIALCGRSSEVRLKPRVLSTGLGQLRALLYKARGFAARLPVPLLLDRQIPHVPRVPSVPQQRLLLLIGRQQPKPRHSFTVSTTTDIPDVARLRRAGRSASSPD